MSSSFIEFHGQGFWSRDGFLEDFAREVAVEIERTPTPEKWLAEFGVHCRLQASGGFGGWIHLHLDEYLGGAGRTAGARAIFRAVIDRRAPADPIHQTGVLMLRLIDGELTTDAASPLDYMVGRGRISRQSLRPIGDASF